MSRISKDTKNKIKEHIVRFLKGNPNSTTNMIRNGIARSWEITNELLSELKESGKIENNGADYAPSWSVKE